MDTNLTLEVTRLSCHRQQRWLFSELSFQLHAGDALWIEGPNGSGKSSLLHLLTGLSTPHEGDILWCHQSIHASLPAYHEVLHYIAHQNGMKSGLSVSENLQLSAHLSLCTIPNLDSKLDEVLAFLQLSAHKHTLTQDLSAGQKRRLSLAKLFLVPRPLWILDEPLTALDVATQQLFIAQLESHLKKDGIAVISSHHPLSLNERHIKTLRLSSC
jgi:heme exporter protein A